MRYRLPVLALLVLPLAQCSCQRGADTASNVPAPEGTAPVTLPSDAPDAAARAALQAQASVLAAQAASSTLHAYLGALPEADRSRADAYWAGGGPGSMPGDAALRTIPGLRSMRIRNEPPVALDRESPPRAYEIPVDLRLDAAAGPRQMRGWYRMRARIDGQGWEITSASLEPVLD